MSARWWIGKFKHLSLPQKWLKWQITNYKLTKIALGELWTARKKPQKPWGVWKLRIEVQRSARSILLSLPLPPVWSSMVPRGIPLEGSYPVGKGGQEDFYRRTVEVLVTCVDVCRPHCLHWCWTQLREHSCTCPCHCISPLGLEQLLLFDLPPGAWGATWCCSLIEIPHCPPSMELPLSCTLPPGSKVIALTPHDWDHESGALYPALWFLSCRYEPLTPGELCCSCSDPELGLWPAMHVLCGEDVCAAAVTQPLGLG